jgi:transcriptional regulator with XRE-family HTH domain
MASKRRHKVPAAETGGPFYLARWMQSLGVSDKQLSEALDVAQSSISRWRTGVRLPRRWTNSKGTQDTIVDIADALAHLTGKKILPSDLWRPPPEYAGTNSYPLRNQKSP